MEAVKQISRITVLVALLILGLWFVSALLHIINDPDVYHKDLVTQKCYLQRGEIFTEIPCTELVLLLVNERLKKVKKSEPNKKPVKRKERKINE